MTDALNSGALSKAELLALWQSSVDELYAQPLLEQGDGHGIEIHEQAQAMLARVSTAIDVTTQALYMQSWSGQTSPSASGQGFASVSLTLTRVDTTKAFTLKAGRFAVLEETNDYGPSGSVPTLTGRRYVLSTDMVFAIGVASLAAVFVADTPGTGFNNPLPNTITSIEQIGGGYFNDHASVSPTTNTLTVANEADVVIPDHVGQYVQFTAGANVGTIGRVVGYSAPVTTGAAPNGGSVQLADLTSALVAETDAASWEVLLWATDIGFHVTHAASPTGGALGMLDALGEERKVRRAPGESDALYSARMGQIADTISPNAIQRAANRVLAPYGVSATLLEVGTASFPGFYFDCDPSAPRPACFAWDLDLTNITDQWKLLLSFTEMRAFFLIEVPAIGTVNETGWAWDQLFGSVKGGAWDYSGVHGNFCLDGHATNSVNVNKQLVQAIEATRAAGVGYDLVQAP